MEILISFHYIIHNDKGKVILDRFEYKKQYQSIDHNIFSPNLKTDIQQDQNHTNFSQTKLLSSKQTV